jgi:hypothetical protein
MVIKKANRIFAINPTVDKTVFLDGKCFWEISLYENSIDHLSLWNTYHINIDGSAVFRLGVVDADERILVDVKPTADGIKK